MGPKLPGFRAPFRDGKAHRFQKSAQRGTQGPMLHLPGRRSEGRPFEELEAAALRVMQGIVVFSQASGVQDSLRGPLAQHCDKFGFASTLNCHPCSETGDPDSSSSCSYTQGCAKLAGCHSSAVIVWRGASSFSHVSIIQQRLWSPNPPDHSQHGSQGRHELPHGACKHFEPFMIACDSHTQVNIQVRKLIWLLTVWAHHGGLALGWSSCMRNLTRTSIKRSWSRNIRVKTGKSPTACLSQKFSSLLEFILTARALLRAPVQTGS